MKTPHALREWIRRVHEVHGVVLLDGGLASELEERGADLSSGLWSAALLSSADGLRRVKEVHAAYFDAGSRVAITATYQVG